MLVDFRLCFYLTVFASDDDVCESSQLRQQIALASARNVRDSVLPKKKKERIEKRKKKLVEDGGIDA